MARKAPTHWPASNRPRRCDKDAFPSLPEYKPTFERLLRCTATHNHTNDMFDVMSPTIEYWSVNWVCYFMLLLMGVLAAWTNILFLLCRLPPSWNIFVAECRVANLQQLQSKTGKKIKLSFEIANQGCAGTVYLNLYCRASFFKVVSVSVIIVNCLP